MENGYTIQVRSENSYAAVNEETGDVILYYAVIPGKSKSVTSKLEPTDCTLTIIKITEGYK